jgi:tRNA(Ile)-lysidine synthase
MDRCGAPWPGAIAVSGGGDSIALMHLLTTWAHDQRASPPVVLTVDHGLHKDSARAAQKVVGWARALGLKTHVLKWKGDKPEADIEAFARQARYHLMGEWCRKHGIATLYVAHTRDDQAETFLLRLARGSGLDGLSAMQAVSTYPLAEYQELRLVRPLIELDRKALRGHLSDLGQSWIDDPMNDELRFARVRIRKAMIVLAAAGLTTSRIADAASHLRRAREALDEVTAAVLQRACRAEGDKVLVEAGALLAAPREVGLRALARVLMAVSGQDYRPRFEKLERLFDAIAAEGVGTGRTLHGCRIGPAPSSQAYFGTDTLVVAREKPRSCGKGGKVPGGNLN